MMPTVGTRAAEWLRKSANANMPHHYTEVAEAIQHDPQNVSTALSRVHRKHPEWGVRRIGGDRSGQYMFKVDWVSEEPPATTPEVAKPDAAKLYEVLGFMDDRTMVVRDDELNMSLWRKVELP